MTDYQQDVRRYTLGWWVCIHASVTLSHYMIHAHARIPDADYPCDLKFSGPIITSEIVASFELIDEMKDPVKRHVLITAALRRMWMRVAQHEFEEWLRLDGERVFTPDHPPAPPKSMTSRITYPPPEF